MSKRSLPPTATTWRDRIRAVLWLTGAFSIVTMGVVLVPVPAHADAGFVACPSGHDGVASAHTTCAFADNVRAAYFTQSGNRVLAYSPATDSAYLMDCAPGYTAKFTNGLAVTAVKCFGGADAEVVLW